MEEPQVMSERISRRIAAIAPSATLAVDAQAKALKAEGHPIIGFGAGEPDFPTPEYIVEAALAAVDGRETADETASAGDLAGRRVLTLSGGERRMAVLDRKSVV